MSQVLRSFIVSHKDKIISRAEERGLQRNRADALTLHHGVPLFISQLIESLEPRFDDIAIYTLGSEASRKSIGDSAALHGLDLLKCGFTVSQVVHGYGDVCQVVTELAAELEAPISASDFHIFNRCLDDAIAGAVTAFGLQRELSINSENTERLGRFAHEIRNLLNTALLSFGILKEGQVGYSGSTSAVLARSLAGMNALAARTLAEVRLEAGGTLRRVQPLAGIVQDLEVGAALQADAHRVQLKVTPVDPEILVRVDRQLLESAVTNLLQNAFKFTRPGGLVSLSVSASHDTVTIEVRDQCGGLPPGKIEGLFMPFRQEHANRSGIGLGLSIAQRAVRENAGHIHARDLPGEGCVFRIVLPREQVAAVEALAD